MQATQTFDVVIIGGGPAGASAALRLLSLGRSVALIEKEIFPRPQIGESLSPGIWNIFRYLQAEQLLTRHSYLQQLPATVIWEKPEPETLDAQHRGPGVMVDRGKLDKDLLDLALERGLQLFQPCRFEYCRKENDVWKVHIRTERASLTVSAAFVLDARGRSGVTIQHRILTAPPVVALWAYAPAARMPRQTLVEAVENGWLWGSPMPDGQFRILSFISPGDLKHSATADVFARSLTGTKLFRQALQHTDLQHLSTCMVFTYAHAVPWSKGYICLGESAFSLDPLSSTGVEKAMRFSLQAVVAVNTTLETGEEQVGKAFYENSMIGAVCNHTRWTSDYYAKAWPADHPFWKERAITLNSKQAILSAFHQKLSDQLSAAPVPEVPVKQDPVNTREAVRHLWHEQVQLSPDLTFFDTPCVVGNVLEVKKAIRHPNLNNEIAYLGEVEIAPLLSGTGSHATFGSIVKEWSRTMSAEQAVKTALFLWNKGIFMHP